VPESTNEAGQITAPEPILSRALKKGTC